MKKIIGVFMTIFLSLGFVSGCSNQKNHGLDPEHPISIQVWNYYNGAQKVAFDQLVDKFNETTGKDEGIIVEVTSKGSIDNIQKELQSALEEKVNASALPNIFSTSADTAEAINNKNRLVSLKDYMSEDEINTYIDVFMEEGRINAGEDIKLFPVAKASEVLIINKTAWDRFANDTGVDIEQLKTWEGLVQIAKTYYEYSGKAFFGRDALMNYLNTGSAQLGSELFTVQNKKGEFTIQKDTMRKLWDHFYIPYVAGYFTKNGKFASDDIKTSDIIASVNSSAGATFFPKEIITDNNETSPIQYQVLPIPNFEGCKPYAISQGAGMAVIKSNEAEEYASIQFLKWISEPEQNIQFTASTSYLPVTKEATKQTTWKKTVKNQNIEISDLVRDTIMVSLHQINDSTIYTAQNFTNSYRARSYLEDSLLKQAYYDQTAVKEALAQGKTLEEAMEIYRSNANFDAWFEKTCNELSELLKDTK